ncbi:hypothetical protein FPZ12_027580 [Amycolatopsis acidicola]|uniref:Uncharacterized protein n=1 Tax=Amycolatopsis acidicola TaxID=2596893 RepID=A0A5N0UWB6_9PSEU|nr:hypothetical protein FPZ12_027580 [Amycolatopsis acidicola]
MQAIQPVIPALFDALQYGLTTATSDHADYRLKRDDDQHYYVHQARRLAVEELTRQGFLARDEDSGRPLVPMSGIFIGYRGVALRVYRTSKARSGKIAPPLPGRSVKKQEFWRQEPALDGLDADNILLTWSDDQGRLDEQMRMYRPVAGDHRRDSFKCSWEGKLTRAMANLRAEDLRLLQADIEYPNLETGTT